MAVGEGALVSNLSYLAVGRETTYGSYNTCTAGMNFLSASLKTMKETKILEEIQTSRTNSNSIQLGKVIEGEIEAYYSPMNLACNYLLQNAFGGGPVTSATATGETSGGGAFQHQVDIANFLATYSSLCLNVRKGQATQGKIFEYSGIRVNELTLSAELDDALMMNASIIAKDSTITSNDVSSVIATSTADQIPLSFVEGRISIENSLASLTSTSFWHVQSFEFKISNNLNSDATARRIGSDTLQVLPAGLAKFEFKVSMRFDTTTAYDAMIANTRLCADLVFQGPTISGSSLRESITLRLPNLRINDPGDPELPSANDPLTSEVSFAVLRDPTTSGGYAARAIVVNNTNSYA